MSWGFASDAKEYVKSSKFASKDWSLARVHRLACATQSSKASTTPNWRSPLPRTARPSWL